MISYISSHAHTGERPWVYLRAKYLAKVISMAWQRGATSIPTHRHNHQEHSPAASWRIATTITAGAQPIVSYS